MPTTAKRRTAADRVRARRRSQDVTVYQAPLPPLAALLTDPRALRLRAPGVTVGLSRALASGQLELTMEGASTVTLDVIDGWELLRLLDADEDLLLDEGVTCEVAGITYRLSAISTSGRAPMQLTFVDDVAWRLQQDSKPLKFSRGQFTRALAMYRMVDEARRRPRLTFPIYIPEINDVQPVARPTEDADGSPGGDPGFAASDEVTVKGTTATKKQKEVIGACLAEANRLKCSERVMVAVVMCLIQESLAGANVSKTGNDDVGFFQQGREWISIANARDPAKATRAFLLGREANVGGTGGTLGWKQRHGSLRKAPDNLDAAIKAVQISVGGYAPWEAEAKRAVRQWDPEGAGNTRAVETAKRYEFTRGTADGRETTWIASGRLAEEANSTGEDGASWHRWVALNAFWYASDEELRHARPSLTLARGAPWLVEPPSFKWGAARRTAEMTLTVLARQWSVLPGAVVAVPTTFGPASGRWLVRSVRSTLGKLEAEITLSRPVRRAAEPAHETSSREVETASGEASRLERECRRISGQGRDYLYGGGHGPKLASISPSAPLDCSSSTSLALKRAGMFDGDVAITSGVFASSWGKPGKGKRFTVYANATHVWIECLDDNGKFKFRFDTSPMGSGERGPRVRTKARDDQARFTARHWPGQ